MREIKSYLGYWVTKQGKVYDKRSGKPVNVPHCRDSTGRLRVKLRNKKGGRYNYVHQLVAVAYCPNPQGKKWVRFKDGNIENVKASNLYFQLDKEVIHIPTGNVFVNIESAARYYQLARSTVQAHCWKKRNKQLFAYK